MKNSLAKRILGIKKKTPVLVCIDGVDGSGKTCFANSLKNEIQSTHRNIVLCSVDNFHHPKLRRYQKGKDSPIGFYKDSYNYSQLISNVLLPFTRGEGYYKDSILNVDRNVPTNANPKMVLKNSILIVEGIFLQRPELEGYWDLKIFLEIDFKLALNRNIYRALDNEASTDIEGLISRYKKRYMPGQKLYFKEAQPKKNADIVIDNSDYNNPRLLKK